MNRYLHRATLRYPRTMDEAFRTHRYFAAIERPLPSVWSRMVNAIKELVR